ncbi:MAG: HlyD family efflux transporter periplasmic adaptor subunit [Alphaproteobacteria bacterium]|nr:HlyD family efflux transporter periplasmic adaptor subunit [Alphaproteobacteria bacterium]
MTMQLRRIVWYALLGAILVAALVYAFRPQPVPVDLAAIERGELTVTIDGDGQTRVREVYVVSAPVPGRVLRIERHVGDAVVANETLLATIQPGDPTFLDRRAQAQAEAAIKAAEAAFALAEAEQARALAELDFARAELNRAEQLAKRGNVSQRDLDRAKLELRTRNAALSTAKASIEMRRFELETARAALIQPGEEGGEGDRQACCVEVYSPVDGRILRVIHESEGVVAAGAWLVELGDPHDLEIVVDLLSGDAVRIREGAEVTIEDWGGVSLAGRVRRVEPYAFTKVSALGIEEQRVNVIVDFTDPQEKWQGLGHGYRVDAHILDWRGEDVLKLPLGALFRDGDSWAVFVAEDGVAKLRHIEIDHGNGREAEVLDGLAEGATVILHPGDRISDGVRVLSRSEE